MLRWPSDILSVGSIFRAFRASGTPFRSRRALRDICRHSQHVHQARKKKMDGPGDYGTLVWSSYICLYMVIFSNSVISVTHHTYSMTAALAPSTVPDHMIILVSSQILGAENVT